MTNHKERTQTLGLVKIRGHNLIHLFPERAKTRQELANLLIQAKYVEASSDPFVDCMLSLPDLIENHGLKFVIVANEPDVLCKECPISQRLNGMRCIGQHQYDADKYCAESFGLKIGQVYTTRELLESMQKARAVPRPKDVPA